MPLTAERWQRVKEIFDAVVELPLNRRAAVLDQRCDSDVALRHEVESLLQSDAQSDGFIEDAVAEVPRDVWDGIGEDPKLGQQFGSYKIIREIGRGGLGTVYLAERADAQYQKQVAIKLVRRGLDTDDILRRFRTERQILAQLDHPNIARLIDGGSTDEGLPYFVMEFVEGEPILEYCETRKLSTSERLTIFLKVCAAVAYAHQNLVIHRDLKPSNILVRSDGEPKLLDFGIAKLLDRDDAVLTVTMPEMRVMTLEYASPEQIKGAHITTASDVYSLGVLLFELLTGERPYRLKNETRDEMARVVTEEEPTRPSLAIGKSTPDAVRPLHSAPRNSKSLRGDLDNIVLMALRKEPHRRYTSVAQFAEDIGRHLEGRPVRARKDTWRYRAGKFIRRNRVGVAAAVLLVLSLFAGVAATVWQAQRATHEAQIAARERDRAERRFRDVRQLSNALLFDIAPKIERLEGSTEARAALVQRALEYLDSLAKESGDDTQLQDELAGAYEKVGELQGDPRKPNLSDFAGAITSYEKARDIRRRLVAQTDNDFEQLRRYTGDLKALSAIRWWTGDTSGSLEDSQSALAAYDKLRSAQPGSLELSLGAAESRIDLANTHYYNDRLAEAYPPLREAIETLEELRQTAPDNSELLRLLGRAYTTLGMTLSWDGKQIEGEAEMAKAVSVNESVVSAHPNDNVLRQGLLDTYLQSSQLFEDADPARSLEILNKARDLAEASVANDTANRQARQNLAKTYSRLGVISMRLGRLEEAVDQLEKSSARFAELAGNEPHHGTYKHDQGRVLMFLGQTRHQQQRFGDALKCYAQAAAVFEQMAAADPGNNMPVRKLATVCTYAGETHRQLAEALSGDKRQRHLLEAKQHYRCALDIFVRLEAQQALTEYDRKEMEAVRAAAEPDE